MAENKALEILNRNDDEMRKGYFCIDDFIEIESANEILEKQIPKKPDFEGDGYDNHGNLIYDTWICPYCVKKYEVGIDEYDYCPNCGQKLDWRLEE